MQKYDVVICGCGPAGSAAGIVLAGRGYSVAMLDRARFPRKKLCGGLLTWKTVKLLETAFGEPPDSLTKAGIINHTSDRYSIKTFHRPLAEGSVPYPFYFVDRMLFDAHLLSRAREAGADVIEAACVTAADPTSGIVTMRKGETVQGQYILGADGANSVVRRSFQGIDRSRFRKFMAPALEISLSPPEFPRKVEHPELTIGFLDAGYGWVFPNRDRVVVGMCGLRHKGENFSRIFHSYLEYLGLNPKGIKSHGYPLPYGNYLGDPVQGRILLAGDAGGFVEPLFGEGIFFALCSGFYAGEAMADGLAKGTHPGPNYSSRLHQYLIPELKASDRLRRSLSLAMRSLGPLSIGAFVNIGASVLGKMVHGVRSYSWLRKKYWDF